MNEPAKIEKVTDEALSRSIISSVIGILLCMVCLVGTTWAWYSLSVESGENETFGANFDFDVTVAKTDTPEGTVAPVDGQYSLVENGTYTVTLTKKGTAEKCFCKVEAKKSGEGTNPSYYIVDFTGKKPAESISFIVTGSGTLKLIPMWGTPAGEYDPIPEGGIELTLDATDMMSQPKEIIQAKELQQPPETEVLEQQKPLTEEPKPEEEPVDKEIGESTKEQTETPTNPETAEPGTPTEPISEPTTEQPVEPPAETPAEPISEISEEEPTEE